MNKDVTICLAAAAMAVKIVNDIAQTGNYNRFDAQICFESIFIRESENTIDIYKNLENLTNGFNTLISLKNSNIAEAENISKYIYQLQMKASLLLNNKKCKEEISKILDEYKDVEIDVNDSKQIRDISELFSTHIRTLDSKVIEISGNKEYLKGDTIYFLRAMLFAAVRALYLYVQLNGHIYRNVGMLVDVAKVSNIMKGNI